MKFRTGADLGTRFATRSFGSGTGSRDRLFLPELFVTFFESRRRLRLVSIE